MLERIAKLCSWTLSINWSVLRAQDSSKICDLLTQPHIQAAQNGTKGSTYWVGATASTSRLSPSPSRQECTGVVGSGP